MGGFFWGNVPFWDFYGRELSEAVFEVLHAACQIDFQSLPGKGERLWSCGPEQHTMQPVCL